jgi:hypothetical protein
MTEPFFLMLFRQGAGQGRMLIASMIASKVAIVMLWLWLAPE